MPQAHPLRQAVRQLRRHHLQTTGQLDAVTLTLQFTTETWTAVKQIDTVQQSQGNPDYPRYGQTRLVSFWQDYVDIPYWSKVYTNYSHSGQTVCQTFVNAQDGWLSGVTVFTTKPAFYNPLNCHIHHCDDQGKPNINTTIRRVTLDAAAIQASYAFPVQAGDMYGVEIEPSVGTILVFRRHHRIPVNIYPIRINFPPVFLKAGQRVAIHLNSTYDHSFSCTSHGEAYQVHQGHFWYSDGSDLKCWLSSPKSLRFLTHYATWGQWGSQQSPGGQLRYEVQLQPLQLAGGIAGVEVLAETIEPAATNISYEVQLAGVWVPFAAGANAPSFAGNPALLPFRIVYTGTTDLMPGVSFTNNQVMMHGPRATTYHHISNSISCHLNRDRHEDRHPPAGLRCRAPYFRVLAALRRDPQRVADRRRQDFGRRDAGTHLHLRRRGADLVPSRT